jgi:hypothetical protein
MSILDTTKLFFDSRFNYMKRDVSTGSANLAAPSVVGPPPLYLYTTTYTVTHNLGIVPFFAVYYEPFADGVIYVARGARQNYKYYNPRNLAAYGAYLVASATTTQLSIEIGSDVNTLPSPIPVYWIIYKDYGVA